MQGKQPQPLTWTTARNGQHHEPGKNGAVVSTPQPAFWPISPKVNASISPKGLAVRHLKVHSAQRGDAAVEGGRVGLCDPSNAACSTRLKAQGPSENWKSGNELRKYIQPTVQVRVCSINRLEFRYLQPNEFPWETPQTKHTPNRSSCWFPIFSTKLVRGKQIVGSSCAGSAAGNASQENEGGNTAKAQKKMAVILPRPVLVMP